MRERIDRLRELAGTPKGNAALTALAVFLGLYLAVAVGLAGSAINLWIGLFWPWHMRTLELAVLLTLGSFAGVSVFVYRLRLQLATGDGAPAWVPEGERAGLTPRARAALAALAVFLGLYLAVGMGLYGSGAFLFTEVWHALIWPLLLWGLLPWAVSLTLASFSGVSLFVYRLRLQLATGDGAPARVPEEGSAGWIPKAGPALTALTVFLGLYLAEGMRLWAGDNWWYVLTWLARQYQYASLGWRATVFLLLPFAAVAFYVYRLKIAAGEGSRALAAELAGCREQIAGLQRDLQAAIEQEKESRLRAIAAEDNARAAREAAREAEARAAAAEQKARSAGGTGQSAGGSDAKFQAARRAFARLYHPDNIQVAGLDKLIRQEIFKEFWNELEDIQKGKR